MPSINRIRVNNVKYNFGTQFYDDFTMRMHGKNTLYDLANGGGKSVLMLLLLQNMIPNCTLDEKQPIEKLFRTGNGNTTIHSLIEWKLDPSDSEEGYRYMTTGFCARKAKDVDGEQAKDVASIEYFNYCIFYREFNKNDIVNLPLVKDKTRVGFSELKSYLKELEHRDMSLSVKLFERKGEYQRFISKYGIHESQWEIIRGINKTEGHVRTYFENNYKTTRKVVEDLLIEEIIEKAFLVKTQREDNGQDKMARMLMDIKEQLTELARKKKDITSYDHQMELISVLQDRVTSFMDIYESQNKLTKAIACIYVTGEEFAKHDEEKLNEIAAIRDEKRLQKNKQREKIECLKVSRDKKQLLEKKNEAELLVKQIKENNKRLLELEKDLNLKESINDYLEYVSDREKYTANEALVKSIMAESSFDEELLYTYTYNIKVRMDVALTDIRTRIQEIENKLQEAKLKKEYQNKLLSQTDISLAVEKTTKEKAKEEIETLSKKLSDINLSMNNMSFEDQDKQKENLDIEVSKIEKNISEEEAKLEEVKQNIDDITIEKVILLEKKSELEKKIKDISSREHEYKDAVEKIENIRLVYGGKDEMDIANIISERLTNVVLEIADLKKQIKLNDKKIARLSEGRIIDVSDGAKKVLDYIETRHGIQAMYGMDYISALPKDNKLNLLTVNPELPFGILVKDYETIKEDPNILSIDTGEETINIFDMDSIEEKALYFGENAFAVHPVPEYIVDEATVNKMIETATSFGKEIAMTLEMKEEMLEAYRQDQEFILKISDSEFLHAEEKLKEATSENEMLSKKLSECEESIRKNKILEENGEKTIADYKLNLENVKADLNRLFAVRQIASILSDREKQIKECDEKIKRLSEERTRLSQESDDSDVDFEEKRAELQTLSMKQKKLEEEWNNTYKAYYNVDKEYDVLTLRDDEIKARFTAMLSNGEDSIAAVEDKKLLMDTLKTSMDRSIKNILKRGIDVKLLADYEFRNLLYFSDDEVLHVCKKNIEDAKCTIKEDEHKYQEKKQAIDRLEGSIDYAISNIMAAFGSYEEVDAGLSEITSILSNGEDVLKRLDREVKEWDEKHRQYIKQQGYMVDLFKDVKRIVIGDDIDCSKATVLVEDKDKLRDIFEDSLVAYDKNKKRLDKAKNELVKFKGNTATTLEQMEVYELATTIRNDVMIPENYAEAVELQNNLKSIIEFIALEKDRIEKSLSDMETIKANFEEQCLQRCLDVKTELDKLPKLSRLVSEGEAINIVSLTVPYVKDEFIKQRMSDYIDKIVAQADDYDSDKDRIKFIKNSLALKKLFGVIVTDMNGIKLNLYKRERIKEQSRYLKYEEAVGSTGQSQGIYIQFLVAIINYIAGMYQIGNEDIKTKTIFIDNPFGAAKDVYIWEPIFAMLKANNVQMIVPARGATPAITGRFDVNYILGQQMSGGKQLTVVTDYTSKVDQDEVEYQDLEYEQVSFDFI